MSIVRAERVDFQIAPGVFLEFYRLPSGEKRIGLTSAAVVCGLRKGYLSESAKRGSKSLKALQDNGFTGQQIPVSLGSSRGRTRAETLSLNDFIAVAEYAALDLGKIPAKTIIRALTRVQIRDIANRAFGESALTLEQIRQSICADYAKTVNWLEDDKADAHEIDEHLLFLEVL